MLLSTSFSFILLIGLSALLEIVIRRRKKSANQNPQFLAFQKSFLGTQLVILLADWLQAPYNYKVQFSTFCLNCSDVFQSLSNFNRKTFILMELAYLTRISRVISFIFIFFSYRLQIERTSNLNKTFLELFYK